MSANIIKLHQSFENRRSIYALNNTLPVSQQAVIDAVEHAILHTPSSFNSQTTRIVVLFDDEHKRLWDITEKNLREIVGNGDFSTTEQKMNGFRAAAGTVLYFEDENDVKTLQEQFALYAQSFPIWAEHTSAMHQYVIWTALSEMGIGANLQHYAPVIEHNVAQAFNIPSNWKMIAQMPFGGIDAPAGDKDFKPISERLRILGQDK
jgi:hypothetical protein